MDNCGVCNHKIPMEHAALNRVEADGTITRYHFACGVVDSPCDDCGQHRRMCSECAEDTQGEGGQT